MAEIKQKIHSELGLAQPELQKLILHGKILKDDQTVKSAGFKERDFLVVMERKVKKSNINNNNNYNNKSSTSNTTSLNTTIEHLMGM